MGLAGVGQRLMDHPSIALSSYIHRGARVNEHTRRHIQVALRYSSGLARRAQGDMFVAALTKSVWHAVGEQLASLLTFVNETYSQRAGQAGLARPAGGTHRRVQFAVRPARPRAPDQRLSQDGGDADVARRSRRSPTTHSRPRTRSRAQDRCGQHQEPDPHHARGDPDGRAGGTAPLRDRQLHRSRDHVRRSHDRRRGAGSLRAQGGHRRLARVLLAPDGPRPDDPMAVVDTQGRVKSVQGLRVVDA